MNTQTQSNNFKFFLPIDIEKGKDSKGEEVYKIKGQASKQKKDSQGETMCLDGMDISDLKTINWNHKSKDNPDAYIGGVEKVIFKNDEMHFEGELYPEMPMAKGAINLMKALKKRGKQLGVSIEGSVIERGHKDKTHPLYNKVLKSKLTALALTPNPINSDTYAELVEKGFTNNDWKFDEETEALMKSFESGEFNETEKAFSVGDNQELVQEDVEGGKNKKKPKLTIDAEELEENKQSLSKKLTKGDVYEKIFSYFYNVDIKKAQSIYNLIEKLATMSTENKEITDETINKAFAILEGAEDVIIKGGKTKEKEGEDEDEEEEDGADKEMMEKAKTMTKSYIDKGLEKAAVISKMIGKGFNENLVNKAYDSFSDKEEKVEKSEVNEDLMKSISALTDNINMKFSAMADIYKSQNSRIEELQETLEEQSELLRKSEETVQLMTDTLSAIAKAPGQRKSATTFTDKHFGQEGIAKGENGAKIFDLKNPTSRKELVNYLTELSNIKKGGAFDEELVQIAQGIEIAKSVETRSLSRLKAMNIEVIG